ncbi:MAG: Isopentenyl-diphosphate Delta-isomerase [Planctomycetota bacterium]
MSQVPPSPAEELFDVVDERDHVIATRSRAFVHQHKLLHRAIHVFLFRPNGQLLIHKRSPAKEEFPSVWTSSCSGHVSAGESYDDSAPRELHEELSITGANLQQLHKFPACSDTSWEFTTLYSTTSNQIPVPDPSEITDLIWLHPAKIAAWMSSSPSEFSPAFRLLLNWFLNSRYFSP